MCIQDDCTCILYSDSILYLQFYSVFPFTASRCYLYIIQKKVNKNQKINVSTFPNEWKWIFLDIQQRYHNEDIFYSFFYRESLRMSDFIKKYCNKNHAHNFERSLEAATGGDKKGFLRNFAKFTGKHLCQSLFFNKVAGIRLFSD